MSAQAWAANITTCDVTVTTNQGRLPGATVRRIDENHANPLKAWLDMGAPDYTTKQQNAEILAASQLVAVPLPQDDGIRVASGTGSAGTPLLLTVTMLPHSVAALRLPL